VEEEVHGGGGTKYRD
jgi:hypothetical protein